MSRISVFIILFVGIFVLDIFYAQERNIEYISVAEGLPQSSVTSVITDSRGFLWVGTMGGGLSMYDGVSFSVFDESNGLSGNVVNDIIEDNEGRIFCATLWGGYTIIKNNEPKIFKIEGESKNKAFKIFAKDGYGTIWGATADELMYFDGNKFREVESDLKVSDRNNVEMVVSGDLLYISSNNSLYTIDIKNKKQIETTTFDIQINALCVTAHRELLLGTANSGIFEYSEKKLLPVYMGENSPGRISCIAESPGGDLWFATDEEIYISNRTNGEYNIKSSSLMVKKVKDFCFDPQGNSWLGTKGKGLVKVSNTPFLYFDEVEGLNHSDNFPIYEDSLGGLYAGNNKGLFYYKDGSISIFDTTNGLSSNKVREIYKYDDKLYIGTTKGANVIENGKISELDYFKDMVVTAISSDESGNLYIGTSRSGLIKQDFKGVFSRIDTTIFQDILSLSYNRKYGLLVGTYNGLYSIKQGIVKSKNNGIPNPYVGGVTIDKYGKIWVATVRGIARWNDTIFETYNIKDGLISDIVYSIHSDKNGFIWIGTNKGLNKLTLDFDSKIIKIKSFGYDEGFKGIECNAKGVFENNMGNIYFSTIKGLHKYEPDYDYYQSYRTPIYIKNVRLFLEEFDFNSKEKEDLNYFKIPKEIKLEVTNNHITIDYFAIDFIRGESIEYTYFLEGFDKQWSPPQKGRYAVYSNLSPGYYTFKVKVAGNEFSEVAELKIVIKRSPPPFFKSTYFLILLFLVLGFAVYYFIVFRNKQLRRQSILLERKVEERTFQILERENEKTVLLQEVHHRVKNNLQIIISLFRLQSHFTENEEAKELFLNSQNRIRSMSKIHEKLYQTKDLSKIEVHSYLKELISEIIQSYDTQNRVIFKSDIQPCQISIDELTPLALIVNEIITNALKYGLKTINIPVIEVVLSQSIIGYTTIILRDNGVGFGQEKWDHPESMGIELIKTLSEQLDGSIQLKQGNGLTEYILSFNAKLK